MSKMKHSGFTLVELVATLIVVGILALTALPRFFDRTFFESMGFADQVQASLRYAQKISISQRRFTCVGFTSNSLTLTVGATNVCGTNLVSISGDPTYSVAAPQGINFAAIPAAFSFDPLGRASIGQTITISGGTPHNIIIEAETGYVHSP